VAQGWNADEFDDAPDGPLDHGLEDAGHHRRISGAGTTASSVWTADGRANAAELERMTAYLESTALEVGIYSMPYRLS
jgi:hypothetical protein